MLVQILIGKNLETFQAVMELLTPAQSGKTSKQGGMEKLWDVRSKKKKKQARKELAVLLNGYASETAALNKRQPPPPLPHAHPPGVSLGMRSSLVEISGPVNPTGL